jgi:hypothetical protein
MMKTLPCSLFCFILLMIIYTGLFAQQTRDPYKQPFAATSPWNTPIGDQAVYVPAGLGDVNGIHVDEDYIVLTPDAPITPILLSNAGWGPNEKDRCIASGGLLQQVPLPKHFVISPENWDGRTPNAGLAVLLEDGVTIIQNQPFARCFPGEPGHTNYTFNTPVNLFEDGLYGAHGGSHLSAIGGAIRLGELVPGGEINHALKINVFGEKYLSYNQVHKGFRWPATTADGYANGNYKGIVDECRMGSLLALPADLDLESLGLQTEPAKILARTFQLYGAYIVDDTAWDVYALITEFSPDGRVKDEFQNVWGFPFNSHNMNHPWVQDMDAIIKSLHVVDNNSPQSVGGGGNPIGPLAPEFGRAGNKVPVLSLVSPHDYQPVNTGRNILVKAEATDSDGEIARVEFYAAGQLIGTADTEPYEINWEVDKEGVFILLAKAIDNEGGVGLSQSVMLNSAPADNAIIYQTIYANNFNDGTANNWFFEREDFWEFTNGVLRSKYATHDSLVAYYQAMTFDEYEYEARVMCEWNNRAGIVFHLQDIDNFYVLEIHPAWNDVVLVNFKDKKETRLKIIDHVFSAWTWYNLKVRVENNKVSGWVNDVLVIDQHEIEYWTQGHIGVYQNENPSQFDDIIIRSLSPTAMVSSQIEAGSNDSEKLNATDGNTDTYWASENELEKAWIKLILEDEILIESISIDYKNSETTTYPVTVSIDGNIWQESTSSILDEKMVLLPHVAGNTILIALNSVNSDGENILAINEIIVKGYKMESSANLPTIVITSPVSGVAKDDGSIIALTANVEPRDFTVQKVEWYLDGYKHITIDAAPYSATLTYPAIGEYIIRARLYTTTGLAIWADAVYLTVKHLTNNPPVVYMARPVNESEFSPNTNVILQAQAFDPETAIKSVGIYLDGVLMATYESERYRFVWRPNKSGVYTVHAVAEDMHGAKTTSAPITIIITGTVSVDEVEAGELLAFPNPASQRNHLTIKLAQIADNVMISLMDVTGRLVYQKTEMGVDQIVVDMNEVKSGKGILILKVDIKNQASIVRNIIVY